MAAGVDVSPVLVEKFRRQWRKAIKKGKVEVHLAGAEALPYPEGYFTRVCSVNSIFYWSDIQQGISEMYRVLQEDGRVVLTYTCKRDLEKKWFVQKGVRTYNEQQIQQNLASSGFREIRIMRDSDRHREFICMTGIK